LSESETVPIKESMVQKRLPSHFSEIRRAALESETIEDLQLYLLRIAAEVEKSYGGRHCEWCHRRLSDRLPASPCIVGAIE
jgi:hypothetical protein